MFHPSKILIIFRMMNTNVGSLLHKVLSPQSAQRNTGLILQNGWLFLYETGFFRFMLWLVLSLHIRFVNPLINNRLICALPRHAVLHGDILSATLFWHGRGQAAKR